MVRSTWSVLAGMLLAGCHGSSGQEAASKPTPDAMPSQQSTNETRMDSVRILECRDERLDLDEDERAALEGAGFTRCAMPFGVLLAADSRMPEAYVRQAVGILAEFLDQDLDGMPDDPKLISVLRRRDVGWLAMPVDPRTWEEEQLPKLARVLGYDIIIPAWWMGLGGDTPSPRARAVMVEEVHHFITQFGLSLTYPEIFGVDDWSSVIARETDRAQCDFWQHPENDCPGNPGDVEGDCSDPNCDVVEFYQQVAVLRAGMEPGWLGIGFPDDASELEGLLSDEIKAVMDDPQYHQLQNPLTFNYPVAD